MTSTAASSEVDPRLAGAAEQAAEGRALDAIEDLTRLNRERRNPEVERRLVELRHQAFPELPTSPGRPAWPAPFADPFPDERGIPTLPRAQLTGEILGGALVHHGCLHLRQLLDEASVLGLRDRIERGFEARERLVHGAAPESVAPWYVPYEPGQAKAEGFGRDRFVRTVDSPGAMWELIELFVERGVLAAVTDYFGERPAMIANKWVLRRSPSGAINTDFHQDGAFLGEGIRTVNCWIALSDCGPGTGRPGLDLIPHRFHGVLPSGEEGATFPWSLTSEAVTAAAGEVTMSSPVFQAGDALFFDERLPHRTGVGPELTTRYAVESWFVAPSSYPAKHLPIVL